MMVGSIVKVIIDRPLGTYHPTYPELYYPINYGYIENTKAPDGEEIDAYVIGVFEPIKEFCGRVIAIIHRLNDVEDKLVVAPENMSFTKEEIKSLIQFQEQYFDIEIHL